MKSSHLIPKLTATTGNSLKIARIDGPLGLISVIADESALYVLEFVPVTEHDSWMERFSKIFKANITHGRTKPIDSIEYELTTYFSGKLQAFNTPFFYIGTPFQERVWEELQKIPYGQTRSYADIAAAIKRPTAYRAVAQANARNKIAIIIPCHRVINASGEMGGYNSGLERKKYLLDLEKQ